MNICLEGPSGNWDWFDADLQEDNLGLNFRKINSICGTTNPMVIDIEYDEGEPKDILQYDGMGWTSINSLIQQAKSLQSYDEDDLEKIAIYMRTKDNDLEYAKKNYDNYYYVQTDDPNPTSLAYVLVREDGLYPETIETFFDYYSFGQNLLSGGYDTEEEDPVTVAEEYIDGVYGGVKGYIEAVGTEEASQYIDMDSYGRTLDIGWTYDDVSGKWISESVSRKTKMPKLHIKESNSNKTYKGGTWKEFIKDLESNSGYKVDSAYRRKYEQWIELIDNNGKIYDAEVTAYYYPGNNLYELQDYNIHPSYQHNESLNPKISDTQIRLVMNRAANLRDYDELDSVISSLLSIDKNLYMKYSEMYRTRKVSAAYIGKEISDDLYYALQDRATESCHTIKESFTNYDIRYYLDEIESKWGYDVMNQMLDWLVDHSDNADDLVDELGYYDIEQMDYWIGYEGIEKVMKHCLETGQVRDW